MRAIPVLFLCLCLFFSVASAQSVQQSGNITPGFCAYWITTGVIGAEVCASGGGDSVVASPAALASANIAPGQTFITVLATAASGTSSCSLLYTVGTATPTGQYQEILNTPSGIYWEPVFATNPVQACQFGTVADGMFNALTNTPSGTDNTSMIQNALDFAMRNNWKSVCLNDGYYYTTDTIAVGWGTLNNTATAFSLSLLSCNQSRASYGVLFAGVTLIPSKYDRCAINVGGGRQNRISGIHIIGGNYVWAYGRYLNANLPVATTAAGWLDPAITPSGSNPGGLTQYASYAAFCVDAYNGSAPSVHYPNQTFPAWLNNTTQYNQAGSTDTLFDNVVVEGFAVGFNIGGNVGQQNGDFNKILNSVCLATVYCVSFGSTQSRNDSMQNINCSNVYTFLTNRQFGFQNGELGGNVLNVGCSQAYQLFDITLSIATTTAQDLYCEACVRVGTITGGSITLRNLFFSANDSIVGTVPAAMVEAGTGGLSIKFDDSKIVGSSRIGVLVHYTSGQGTVTVNGGTVNGGINSGTLFGTTGSQTAVNYTGGYFAGASFYPNAANGFANQLFWQGQSYATNMTGPTQSSPGLTLVGWTQYPVISNANTRQILTQANISGFYDAVVDFKYWKFLHGPIPFGLDMTSTWASTPTLTTCDTWTGTWSPGQETGQNSGLNLGDIFYHLVTGTLWVVESVGVPNPTNYPVVLRQHNNLSVNASQTGGTLACTANNLAVMPSGNTILTHVGLPSAVTAAAVQAGGSGYTNGTQTLTVANGAGGSTGVCTASPTVSVTVSGNVVASVNSISNPGLCPMPLTNPAATTGGGGTGATLNLTYTPGVIAVPGTVYYCDFAAGSNILHNCGRGDGVASSMASVLFPGDKFWATPFNDPAQQWPYSANTSINSVTNGSPGTISLSTTATLSGRFAILPFENDLPWVSAQQSPFRYSAAGVPLPTCNTNTNNTELYVSDATTPMYYGAYASGGGIQAGVLCINGTGWVTK